MTRWRWVAAVVLALAAWTPESTRADQTQDARRALCEAALRPPAIAAEALEAFGEAGREALLHAAASSDAAEATCGIAGLAALRDRRIVTLVQDALTRPTLRDEAYRLLRLAAYVAGGPDTDLGAVFLPLVESLADGTVWAAGGDDAIRFLGEVDHPSARDRLVTEMDRPQTDAALDALMHALARQGDPRVQARVATLGQEAVGSRSGNTTFEQARRMGAVAFYQLALGTETMSAGVAMLQQLAPADQADTAAWAMQTWCERAIRRAAEQPVAARTRVTLAGELERLDVRWSGLERGAFRCALDP